MASTVLHSPARPSGSRELARFLRGHALPGCRSEAAIRALRRGRQHRRAPGGETRCARERLLSKLLRDARHEILRRGGETQIETGGVPAELAVVDRDPHQRIVLVAAHGWRRYSGRFGSRPASLAYLYGVDDSGPWAVRLPGTMTSVAESLAWLTPAEVRDAMGKGRRVRRQGDVYAVETTPAHDGAGTLPDGHRFNPDTRYLTHHPVDGRKHRPVRLSWPVRFVQQRALVMGRGSSRAAGD